MDETTNTAAVETTAAGTTTATETTAAGTGTQATAAAAAEQQNAFQKFLATLGFGGGKDKETETKEEKADKGDKTETGKETGKTYSQADLDAALAKAQQDWETKAQEKANLEKLSPEERSKAEAAAKDKEVSDLKAQLLAKDLKENAVSSLNKDGFPVELADLLDYTSKENMEKSLTTVQDVFKNALASALKDKLRGKTPTGLGDAASAEGSLKDQIAQNIRGGLM